MRKALPLILALALGLAGLLLALLAVRRAALPYNAEGRFYDAAAGIVYSDSAPLAYGLLAALALLVAALCAVWARRARRR